MSNLHQAWELSSPVLLSTDYSCWEIDCKARCVPYACNSALICTSVAVFGTVRMVDDEEEKEWFFDRLLEKDGDPSWTFAPGYPSLDRILLYEVQIESLTGKRNEGHCC